MSAVRRIAARLRARAHRLRDLRRRQKADRRRLAKAKKLAASTKHALIMFDSIYAADLPKDAPAVAGYVGGSWPTFASLAKLFPKARRLSIAVASHYDADCLDIESGDATPADAPAWVERQRRRGVKRPVVYSSVSEMPAVLAALKAHGIKREEVRVWTAHYNFKPHRCSANACGYDPGGGITADATQWTNRSHGRSLDESQLASSFFT